MGLSDARSGRGPLDRLAGHNPAPFRASRVASENRPCVPLPTTPVTIACAPVGCFRAMRRPSPRNCRVGVTTVLSEPARDSLRVAARRFARSTHGRPLSPELRRVGLLRPPSR